MIFGGRGTEAASPQFLIDGDGGDAGQKDNDVGEKKAVDGHGALVPGGTACH